MDSCAIQSPCHTHLFQLDELINQLAKMNVVFATLISLSVFSNVGLGVQSEFNPRHQALLLMNLVKNVDWEEEKIVIGVVGDSPVTGELTAVSKRNPKIEVRFIEDLQAVRDCQIVYLPDATNKSFFLTQNEIGDNSTLLVVDKKEMIVRGAEMGFYFEDDKMKMAFNQEAVQASGVKISHVLLDKASED